MTHLWPANAPAPTKQFRLVASFLAEPQPPEILTPELERTFFNLWMEQWKNRNQVNS
jgi:hypothetical protein